MALIAATAKINYPWGQASSDLYQIAPITALAVALLVVVVADLLLPVQLRPRVAALLAILGFAVSGALAGVRLAQGGGGPAYSGFASGDAFGLYLDILFACLGIGTVLVAQAYLRRTGLLGAEFHFLALASVIGMMVLASATSLVSLFLGLELLSIALYVATAYNRRQTRAQEAAAKYLMIGGFASAFVLYGMALLYGATGTTQLAEIARRVTEAEAGNPLLLVGVGLLGVGFAFKVSAAPFHMWTPDVYEGATLPVTAFMSVGTKAAAFAMIVRVFAGALPHMAPEWQALLAFVAAASMIVGNLMAIVQGNLKRLLAYSSVAQAGYILVGVAAGGKDGISAVLFYLFAYLFMNFGAFAILTLLAGRDGERERLADLDGLGFQRPLLGILMTVFMLSLAGFPPTAGFIGKVFLFEAGIAHGFTWLVVVAVLTSVISVYYYFRVLLHVWTPAPAAPRAASERAPLAVIALTGLGALVLGVYPALLLGLGLTGAGTVLAAVP
jgi:NADH-quinone oxidoreductase subunit N